MKRALAGALLFAVVAAPSVASSSRPHVVVTTSILGDIVQNVAGEHVNVTVLVPPGSNPHAYAPSAAQRATMTRADLVIANGLGLEENLRSALTAARADGVRVIELAPRLRPLRYGHPAGREARALDPHVWMDVQRMAQAAGLIAAELARTAPPGVERRLLARGQRQVERLQALDRQLVARIAVLPVARRKLVTNHHNYGYYAHRYSFRVRGAVIPSGTALASPSAADFAELAQLIRRERVSAIFVDASEPKRLAAALAREAGVGVRVVTLHGESLGLPGSGAETYERLMRSSTERIVRALSR